MSGQKRSRGNWITKDIKIPSIKKRQMYLGTKKREQLIQNITKPSQNILKKVVDKATQLFYSRKIKMPNNIAKTTWNIIKNNSCKDICNAYEFKTEALN